MSADLKKVVEACTRAWRQTGDRRFATFADWATARALSEPRPVVGAGGKKADVEAWAALEAKGDVLDFPRLVAALSKSGKSALATERLEVLEKRRDPRLVTAVLRLLEAPPWRAGTAMPFFRACAEVLAKSNDRQVRADLLDLASRYRGIVETTMGVNIAALLNRTANELDQVKPGPPSAAQQQLLDELAVTFAAELSGQQRTTSAKAKSAQSDDALLAAIYERPDDDGPRTVFADTLTERGDVRGEFISLQLARARGEVTRERLARERTLAADQKQRSKFCLPLSQGGDCVPWRGFPRDVALNARGAKDLVGLPAWRTVEVLRQLDGPSKKVLHGILFSEHARDLKEVHGLTTELIDGFPDGPLPWTAVGFSRVPAPEQARRFPKLTRAHFFLTHGVPFEPAWLSAFSTLTSLVFGVDYRPAFDVLAALPKVTSLGLFHTRAETAAGFLASATHLRSLELDGLCAPFAAPALEDFTVRFRRDVPLAPLLDGMPRLARLRLSTGYQEEARGLAAFLEAGRARLGRLASASVGPFHFERPFADDGVLAVRSWMWGDAQLAAVTAGFALLPEGLARRVVLRPDTDDPLKPATPPLEAQVATLRAATKLPLDVEF